MTGPTPPFDLQAHRGGAGLHPENTLEAFGGALTLGVSTLELDVHLTSEEDVVVAHDPALADARMIRHLTRADLPPSMPLLREVAALLEARGATPVRINLEIKYDAVAAAELTSREDFVAVVVDAIRIDGLVDCTSVQCFDWDVLRLVEECEPRLRRNVLASDKYLQPGRQGASPWLGELDIDDVPGGWVEAAAAAGFDAISPIHGSPFLAGVDDASYVPFVDLAMTVAAHDRGLAVIPYVVDDEPTMRHLVDLGVDGLITNRPDRLRGVLAAAGRTLPEAFPG
ncbi:glycerophosphodiester phosphodiesterase [Nocardioides seonyuensis]|uniref:Glycerophosphodiester phosphodiesterase n=1 Tax=Nocardioides seonyuensis TaxID=2518371 RepID=A0A4P7IIW3_9ACTN|nr:glycerophosphodiester phosphodiesterase family protein [Nocardioides seonyuensis]QBX56187.1 glycerophosphodiester phosphodiesterase [Nocardioides seonyuensis]